jgi:hypothetical protein
MVVCEPDSVRVVARVAVLPAGPVTTPEVLPGDLSTLRLAVRPFGPVVLELTSPCARLTLRLAVLPCGPVALPLRSRASACPANNIKVHAPRHAITAKRNVATEMVGEVCMMNFLSHKNAVEVDLWQCNAGPVPALCVLNG